jgi:hypothetical protein
MEQHDRRRSITSSKRHTSMIPASYHKTPARNDRGQPFKAAYTSTQAVKSLRAAHLVQ